MENTELNLVEMREQRDRLAKELITAMPDRDLNKVTEFIEKSINDGDFGTIINFCKGILNEIDTAKAYLLNIVSISAVLKDDFVERNQVGTAFKELNTLSEMYHSMIDVINKVYGGEQ